MDGKIEYLNLEFKCIQKNPPWKQISYHVCNTKALFKGRAVVRSRHAPECALPSSFCPCTTAECQLKHNHSSGSTSSVLIL